jgi:hypothetical protein
MPLEIGVVCGQCDTYSPAGTVRCPACAHDLALARDGARPSLGAVAVSTASAIGAVAPAVAAPLEVPSDRRIRTHAQLPALSSMASSDVQPAGERRSTTRPQPLPAIPHRSVRPNADALERATTTFTGAAAEAIARAEATSHPVSVPPSGSIPPRRGESWGHETTAKIPLRPVQSNVAKGRSKEELMEQARNFVCRSCQTPIPSGHKFCGRCGASVPHDILTLREEFYGTLQVPGRAKLIMIRADGDPSLEGISYALNAQEHIIGREGNLTWPEDRFVSARHANVFYRGGNLVIRDEGSLNGVYVRMRGSMEVHSGDTFFAGEQLFRIDATPKRRTTPKPTARTFGRLPNAPARFGSCRCSRAARTASRCARRRAASPSVARVANLTSRATST